MSTAVARRDSAPLRGRRHRGLVPVLGEVRLFDGAAVAGVACAMRSGFVKFVRSGCGRRSGVADGGVVTDG